MGLNNRSKCITSVRNLGETLYETTNSDLRSILDNVQVDDGVDVVAIGNYDEIYDEKGQYRKGSASRYSDLEAPPTPRESIRT